MKLLATHAFNCIVLMVKFGRTSCEDIPLALIYIMYGGLAICGESFTHARNKYKVARTASQLAR